MNIKIPIIGKGVKIGPSTNKASDYWIGLKLEHFFPKWKKEAHETVRETTHKYKGAPETKTIHNNSKIFISSNIIEVIDSCTNLKVTKTNEDSYSKEMESGSRVKLLYSNLTQQTSS